MSNMLTLGLSTSCTVRSGFGSRRLWDPLWAIIMMNIGLMGIMYRAERRFRLIEPDSLLMMVVYVLGLWLLFNG